ncbi:hypothetical protein E2C01_030647 [Portunus trituberculatus]|uniref:Uncharacterized protein n=1 Tax=Portunus trituberculatus TaxID=210409 RepID=A0A5B7EWB7_PORTR|nr:hypothetical protein [Portunus trituberculatus]
MSPLRPYFFWHTLARRVSGLHGLSAEVRHSKCWTSMTVSFAPDFLAKTQCLGQHSFDEFTFPGLLDFVREDKVVRIFAGLGIVGRPALGYWSQFWIPDELSTLIPCLSGFVRSDCSGRTTQLTYVHAPSAVSCLPPTMVDVYMSMPNTLKACPKAQWNQEETCLMEDLERDHMGKQDINEQIHALVLPHCSIEVIKGKEEAGGI